MAVEVSIKIDMSRFAEDFSENITREAVRQALKVSVLRARADNGRLRRSIKRGIVNKTKGFIGTDLEYAAAQEYGLSNQPTRIAEPESPKSGPGGPYTFNPFLRPAVQFTAEDIRNGKFVRVSARKALRSARVG